MVGHLITAAILRLTVTRSRLTNPERRSMLHYYDRL